MDAVASLFRPKQWAKNGFIFLPLFFVGSITNMGSLARTFVVFVVFCLMASGVYVFNDLMDVEEDRQHPIKMHRPIAAGTVSRRTACLLMAALLSAAMGSLSIISFPAGRTG